MTATRKFMNLGAWALDMASDVNGPVEAEAFLRGAMAAVGVKTKKVTSPKGRTHKAASESNRSLA